MRATWGHFSSYVAATLESWKLRFRLHQTLLFRVLRGWVKTFRPTFFKFFSEKGLETLFYDLLRIWGSSRTSKDDFCQEFQVHLLRFFLFYNFSMKNQILSRARGEGDYVVSGTLNHWFTDHWKLTSDQKKLIVERRPKPASAAWWPL